LWPQKDISENYEEVGMKKDQARILVIGAGVNGSICAVGLFNAGFDVTLLARGKRYQEICDGGIVIEDPFKNTRSLTKVSVINCLELEDCYDYILVVIRKNQVPELLPVLARNRSPNVVFMVNNPSGPDEFIRALGKERILLGWECYSRDWWVWRFRNGHTLWRARRWDHTQVDTAGSHILPGRTECKNIIRYFRLPDHTCGFRRSLRSSIDPAWLRQLCPGPICA
jgi:ketopantoate reductase